MFFDTSGRMIMVTMRALSPMVHQWNNGLYRVPLLRVDEHYTIYVADNFTREYDEQTLPDEVKTNLTMILARPKQLLYDDEVTKLGLFTSNDADLLEVGWRVSDSWFLIVLPIEVLMRLRGETNGNDT